MYASSSLPLFLSNRVTRIVSTGEILLRLRFFPFLFLFLIFHFNDSFPSLEYEGIFESREKFMKFPSLFFFPYLLDPFDNGVIE